MTQSRRQSNGSVYSVLDQYPLRAEPVDQAALREARDRALKAKASMAEVSELDAIIGMNEFCLGITEDPQLQGWHRGNMATARQRRLEEVENIATHRFNETSYRIKAQTGTGKRIIELGNKHTQYDDGTRPGQKPMQARLKQNTSRTKRASVSSTGVSSQASRAASRTKSNAGSFVVAGSATSKTPYPPSGTTKEKPEERKMYRRVLDFLRL